MNTASDRNRLLLLDFDGVICDSAVECMITSYNAYQCFRGHDERRVYSRSQIDAGKAADFLENRAWVRVAGEYYLLWLHVDMGEDLAELFSSDRQDDRKIKSLKEFHDLFFQERDLWRREDRSSWLEHNPVYKPFLKSLSDPELLCNSVIISAKDVESIISILQYHGIEIEHERIFGSNGGHDKDSLLVIIHDKYGVPFSEMHLLDDNLVNLETAQNLGVSTYMAGWGYLRNSDRESALSKGMPVLELANIMDWLREYRC